MRGVDGLANALIVAQADLSFIKSWYGRHDTFDSSEWDYHSCKLPLLKASERTTHPASANTATTITPTATPHPSPHSYSPSASTPSTTRSTTHCRTSSTATNPISHATSAYTSLTSIVDWTVGVRVVMLAI